MACWQQWLFLDESTKQGVWNLDAIGATTVSLITHKYFFTSPMTGCNFNLQPQSEAGDVTAVSVATIKGALCFSCLWLSHQAKNITTYWQGIRITSRHKCSSTWTIWFSASATTYSTIPLQWTPTNFQRFFNEELSLIVLLKCLWMKHYNS